MNFSCIEILNLVMDRSKRFKIDTGKVGGTYQGSSPTPIFLLFVVICIGKRIDLIGELMATNAHDFVFNLDAYYLLAPCCCGANTSSIC